MRKFLAALIAFAFALPAAAQDWKAEWDKTVAAANKEGKVVVVMSPTPGRRNYLLTQWKADFPGIELSLSIMPGPFVQQVVTERNAGSFLWDVWHSGPNSGHVAISAGLIDELPPEFILPEIKDEKVWGGWDNAFYDKDKKRILGLYNDLQTPYYNAKAISPDHIKQVGLKVLLEPQLKGKIVWFDPRYAGPGAPFMVLIGHVLGEDALWKIIKEQDPIFVPNLNESAQAMVRNKAVFAIGGQRKQNLQAYTEAGIAVDMRDLGNTPETAYLGTDGGGLGVFTKRPHPNAARVFVNWIMTKKVLEGISRADKYDARRSDIPPLDPAFAVIPDAHYIQAQRIEYDHEMRGLQAELKKVRPN